MKNSEKNRRLVPRTTSLFRKKVQLTAKSTVIAERQQRGLRDNGLKRTHSRSLYFADAMLSSRFRTLPTAPKRVI